MRKLFEMAIIVAVVAVLLASGIRFVLLSNGATESSFVFSVAGDYGAWNGFMESLNQLKQTRSDFAIALGDLSYGGIAKPGLGTEEGWCKEFHDAFQNLVIVAGNHDTGDTLPGEGDINQFAQYCPAPPQFAVNGDYGKQYYFDYPKGNPIVRFILLSPELVFVFDGGEHYRYNVGTPRYNWTRDTIDQARAAGIPWVIVGMHKNCIGAGEHACETGPDILNLLVGKKVDLILNAHTHNYERSKQLALNADSCAAMQLHIFNGNCIVDDGASHVYKRGQGSVVVIAGTGGRDIDPFNLADPYAGSGAHDLQGIADSNGGRSQAMGGGPKHESHVESWPPRIRALGRTPFPRLCLHRPGWRGEDDERPGHRRAPRKPWHSNADLVDAVPTDRHLVRDRSPPDVADRQDDPARRPR